MDNDWADSESVNIIDKAYGLIEENDVLITVTAPGLGKAIADALRKVRRDTIESCAVIAESVKIEAGNPLGEQLNRTADQIARYIRESEGKV